MEAKKLVGWNVRKLRVARKMTLEELADHVDSNASYLAELERGEVNVGIELLDRVARAIGAKLGDLTVEPKPGEKPPAPLRAGRRPRK